MEGVRSTVTDLLAAHREGDTAAFDRLIEVVYQHLRHLAHVQRRRRRPDAELNTTALVHELYCKLVEQQHGWRNRGHFFAACATAMRHLLVDEARSQLRQKRGGGEHPLTLDERRLAAEGDPEWLLYLDQLMDALAEHDARLVRVFECRYFCGFSTEETAESIGLSRRTVERDWQRARAWLGNALTETRGNAER